MKKTKKLIGSKLIKVCIAFIMVFSGMLGLLPNSFGGNSLSLCAATTSSTMTSKEVAEAEKTWKAHGKYLSKFRSSNTKKCVTALQRLLNFTENTSLSLDGTYGPAVEKAVKNFQKKNKLVVDGCAGPKVWEKLLSKAKVKADALTVVPTVSFSGISVPTSLSQGKCFNLTGKVYSNVPITKFTGSIINSSGKTVMTKTVSANTKSLNIATSAVNSSLSFGKLNPGTYLLHYLVVVGNKTFGQKYNFTVIGKSSSSKVTLRNGKILNASDIFVCQYNSYFPSTKACTLASHATLFKAKLAMQGKSTSISLSKLWKTGWVEGIGAKHNYRFSGMEITTKRITGSASAKEKEVRKLLATHPEGVALYCYNNTSSHCVYITLDSKNNLRMIDPAYSSSAFRSLSESANSVSRSFSEAQRVFYLK